MRKGIQKIFTIVLPAGLCFFSGCKEKSPEGELPPEEVADVPSFEEEGDPLAGMPGPLYESVRGSAVQWHPWTKESFEKARMSKRLVLAMVVMPQYPAFEKVLRSLDENPKVVSTINKNYLPILIDGDAAREMGLLTVQLLAERGMGLHLPLLIYMSPDGDPVGWTPISGPAGDDPAKYILQSQTLLSEMWDDDDGYILRDSAANQEMRSERLEKLFTPTGEPGDPAELSRGALRQLASLYDPVTRSLDNTGGLFPTGALDLLAAGVLTENLPEASRKKSQAVLGDLLDDLLDSPMFDPLAGGVYETQFGRNWSLPGFAQTCSGQARIAVSLFESYAATGDERAREKAQSVLKYAEESYKTEDGLFSFGHRVQGDTDAWLWSSDDLRKLLSPQELSVVWLKMGLEEEGNIPAENDSKMNYFQKNTLFNAMSVSEVSKALKLSEEEVVAILESGKGKLLDERRRRLAGANKLKDANADATFRMVTAYATAYRNTGDENFKAKAKALLSRAKETFVAGRRLRLYAAEAPDSVIGGRAFLYALAIQASLNVQAITLEEEWKFWAADLMSTAAEIFVQEGYIREVAPDMNLSGLPISDISMLFGESTLGMFSMAVNRLSVLGIPAPQTMAKAATHYSAEISTNPIVHADLAAACLLDGYGKKYLVGKNVTGKLREAIMRLPLAGAPRVVSTDEPDKVRVLDFDGKITEVRDVSDIAGPPLR